MRYLFSLSVSLLVFSCLAQNAGIPAAPVEIQNTQIYSESDFDGEWLGYWSNGKRFLARTATAFILTKDKDWQISTNDSEPKSSGSFYVTDNHVCFKLTGRDDGELLAEIINPDNFVFKEETKSGRSVVYRRRSKLPSVTREALKGVWRFTDERKSEKGEIETVNAPFTIEFNEKGLFQIQSTDKSFKIPPGLEKGTFFLQEDLVSLKDANNQTRMQFFFIADSLTNNNLERPFIGRKDK